MGKSLNINEMLLVFDEYKGVMEDYINPYLEAKHNGYTISDLVFDYIDIHKGVLIFQGMPEEYEYDEGSYYRESTTIEIPFSLFVDFAGTIKKLKDEYNAKITAAQERQRQEDMRALANLRSKYPEEFNNG